MLVSISSYLLGRHWAKQQAFERMSVVVDTLTQQSFPLSGNVVPTIGSLTGIELIALGQNGELIAQTSRFSPAAVKSIAANVSLGNPSSLTQLNLDGMKYQAILVRREVASRDGTRLIWLLYPQLKIDQASQQMAVLPLATGLATISILLLAMSIFAYRYIRRIEHLKQSVSLIAEGDFEARVGENANDELGDLGAAVDSMSQQLQNLWTEVNRQQGAKLLHQLASGMAHQLRNTLTGSRMAVELQAKREGGDSEELQVALRQLEIAEDYVRRLLSVGKGQIEEAHEPATLWKVFERVRAQVDPIAQHHKIDLAFDLDSSLENALVSDGQSLFESVSNLIINGLEAGKKVEVTMCRVVSPTQQDLEAEPAFELRVVDDGPGIQPELHECLFEPFVTSKPEGVGLGLPVAAKAIARLGGELKWLRSDGKTVFFFQCPLQTTKYIDSNDGR